MNKLSSNPLHKDGEMSQGISFASAKGRSRGVHPPKNRKDHHVPQGYLKGFIDPARKNNNKPLWCLDRWRNEWERKAPSQICHVVGMYDFANDAIEAEHADVTFKTMEDGFPPLCRKLQERNFAGWREHLDFLRCYMQMFRVRSPQFFEQKGTEVARSFVGRVVSVDEENRKVTFDTSNPLTDDEVHDFTLTRMREEFKQTSTWMDQFYWQVQTTFDPYNPVVASEAPLFLAGEIPMKDGVVTEELVKHESTVIYFPLCWQACLVGRKEPFDTDTKPFGQEALSKFRHMIAQLAPQYVIAPQIVQEIAINGRAAPTVRQRRD